MRKWVSLLAVAAIIVGSVSCERAELKQKTPEITTLSAENGPYFSVTLSGSISGLEAVALDFQCGFEYCSDAGFGSVQKFKQVATTSYSEEPFSVTLQDLIPGQKYYYRAYYINQMYAYYGEVKNFTTDEWTGPGAVDLGLSVKWADINVDAYRPWEAGSLYAWGEIEPKESYMWDSYKFYHEGTMKLTKYCNNKIYGYEEFTDNLTALEPEDDVAHVKWGGNWRIPSKEEFLELMNTDNCTWTYTTMNGMTGYRVESKKNGNSIFLPDASDNHGCQGGLYWTNTIDIECAPGAPHLYFNKQRNIICFSTYTREYGLTIRPVCK